MELPILHGNLFTDETEPELEPAAIRKLLRALEKAPTPTVGTNGSLVPKIQTHGRVGKRKLRKPHRFL